MSITADRLRELLHYDPDTGIFTWRVSRRGHAKPGDIAGAWTAKGYRQIVLERKTYKAHRLAFLYMTGDWPAADVDHRDGNPSNNAWINLRPATRSQNNANSGLSSANKSGFKGVSWAKNVGKWGAYIKHEGRKIHLGYYHTADMAASVRAVAAKDLHGKFARAE